MDVFFVGILKGIIAIGTIVFNINNGTSSFWSMSHDFEQPRKPNPCSFVIRGIQSSNSSFRRCNFINWLGRIFQVISKLLSYNLKTMYFNVEIYIYRKRGSFLKLVKPNTSMANWLSEEQRSLLRAMSMTVCDLSAITKPWPIEKRVADLVTSEFFEQGDMERQELNITPIVSVKRIISPLNGF